MAAILSYTRVQSLAEALDALQRAGTRPRLLAGGTDLLPLLHSGRLDGAALLDLSDVPELQGITEAGGEVRIGAATRLADIVHSAVLTGGLHVVAAAAERVGSVQIRHLATLGGNLCNASPSADTAPALLVLDAVAVIASPAGERRLPLGEFFTGPGRTALAPGELLAAIVLPARWRAGAATYLKHSPREAMDLAIAGAGAAFLRTESGLPEVRIALGAVAPTPVRARRAERALIAAPVLDEVAIEAAAACAADEVSPIDDVRASAAYRRRMTTVLVQRALRTVLAARVCGQGGNGAG